MTFMPSLTAMFAMSEPIAPRPMTPRVLPVSSGPEKAALPFSTRRGISSPLSLRLLTQSMLPSTSREDMTMEQMMSSLTASAFAPGLLKTTMPLSQQRSSGMLFVPAPLRAMTSRLSPKG